MLFIDKEKIQENINLNEMMDIIEHAYDIFWKDDYYMPLRQVVEYENKSLMYMPCYTKDIIGTKILSIFPDNANIGLPSIDGLVVLNDPATGKPEAVLDGQEITAWRTGAIGGVAIRHLAKKDASSVAIIGAGVQAFHLALYACMARKINNINIYNHSDRDLTEFVDSLKKSLARFVGYVPDIEVHKDIVIAVSRGDIICTATPSERPIIPDDKSLFEGKCVVAIGSYTPEMREIPNAIWSLVDKVYVELPYACKESGDLSQPLDEGLITTEQVALMSDFLKNKENTKIGNTTYFKSVGMALFDVCASEYLFKKILK